jgi:hypothetical protein
MCFAERNGAMLDWMGLLVVLGFVTVILVLYMLITRSAGIYATTRKFWNVALLSASIAYLLSGGLYLFLHLNATIAVAISAVVPFVVGNLDLGEAVREPAPGDEGLESEALPENDEEDEALADEEDEAVYKASDKNGSDEMAIYNPDEMRSLWN